MGRSFPAFISRINEPTLRSTQVLKEEVENIGLTGKEVAEYVREQQTLGREERAAWRDTKKRQAEDKKMQVQAGNWVQSVSLNYA